MANIISEQKAPDGYDVVCILSTGERHVFHFAEPPKDIQPTVDALEVGWAACIAAQASADDPTPDAGSNPDSDKAIETVTVVEEWAMPMAERWQKMDEKQRAAAMDESPELARLVALARQFL